jgi:hypothetical protein
MVEGVLSRDFVAKLTAAKGGADFKAVARDHLLRAGGPSLAGLLVSPQCAPALDTYADALRVLTLALGAFTGTIPQAIDLAKASMAYASAFADLSETMQRLVLEQPAGTAQ